MGTVAWGMAGAPCPNEPSGEHVWGKYPVGYGCGSCAAYVTNRMLEPITDLIELLPASLLRTRWKCSR